MHDMVQGLVGTRGRQGHPLIVRVTHWLTALAVIILIGSGWRIYDQEPAIAYFIPLWATLGGEPSHSLATHGETGFANALMWHFGAATLMIASFTVYLSHGLLSGRFLRNWFPITPRAVAHDAIAALTFRLTHQPGSCNAVQKLCYVVVVLTLAVMLASGLAIWKPVQLWWLTALFGGFQEARLVHLLGMCAIVVFTAVHVVMAALVPRTIQAITIGRAAAPGFGEHVP